MGRAQYIVGIVVAVFLAPLSAQEPNQRLKKETLPRSYSIGCKFTQNFLQSDDNGRSSLKTTTVVVPEFTTLEDSNAAYTTETRQPEQLFQHIVQARVQRISAAKVRVELQLENAWSDGGTNYRKSLQCSRIVSLGSKLKLTLQEKNDERGEGIWAEIVINEASEE